MYKSSRENLKNSTFLSHPFLTPTFLSFPLPFFLVFLFLLSSFIHPWPIAPVLLMAHFGIVIIRAPLGRSQG